MQMPTRPSVTAKIGTCLPEDVPVGRELTSLRREAEAPEAPVTQDIEVVVLLGIWILAPELTGDGEPPSHHLGGWKSGHPEKMGCLP